MQTRPVGAECWHDDGYLWVKVAMPNKWQLKHHIVWEAVNGPIPKGHLIIFGDGDRKNFDVNNLICITRAELAVLNQKHLIFDNADATRAGLLLTRLIKQTAKLKRGEKP